MNTSPSSSAKQAQEALGARLREIRKDPGLSARALAAATGRLGRLLEVMSIPTVSLWVIPMMTARTAVRPPVTHTLATGFAGH